MAREYIIASEVYTSGGGAHAVRVDGVVYTAAIEPVDVDGRLVGRGDLGAQAAQVYRNLDVVLRRAGTSWGDVVKVHTYVAPQGVTAAGRRALRVVEDRYLPAGGRTGLSVCLPLAEPDWLVAVEVIAHPGTPKRCITDVPGVAAAPGWAHAVRVGDFVYLGGQVPVAGHALSSAEGGAAPVAAIGDATAQVRAVYGHHDTILKHASLSWNDVFEVHQYVTRTDLNLNGMRAVRSAYLRLGKFVSTSVVCEPEHPQWPLEDWLLAVDMEAHVGPKEFIHAPGVWRNPDGVHGIKIGKTIYPHTQVPRDLTGKTLYPDDAGAQAKLTYQNLDGILRAAGTDWGYVVHVKTFCKRREDLAAVRQVRSQWLRDGQYAGTDLVAAFFDPALLVEIEVLAVTD